MNVIVYDTVRPCAVCDKQEMVFRSVGELVDQIGRITITRTNVRMYHTRRFNRIVNYMGIVFSVLFPPHLPGVSEPIGDCRFPVSIYSRILNEKCVNSSYSCLT